MPEKLNGEYYTSGVFRRDACLAKYPFTRWRYTSNPRWLLYTGLSWINKLRALFEVTIRGHRDEEEWFAPLAQRFETTRRAAPLVGRFKFHTDQKEARLRARATPNQPHRSKRGIDDDCFACATRASSKYKSRELELRFFFILLGSVSAASFGSPLFPRHSANL